MVTVESPVSYFFGLPSVSWLFPLQRTGPQRGGSALEQRKQNQLSCTLGKYLLLFFGFVRGNSFPSLKLWWHSTSLRNALTLRWIYLWWRYIQVSPSLRTCWLKRICEIDGKVTVVIRKNTQAVVYLSHRAMALSPGRGDWQGAFHSLT